MVVDRLYSKVEITLPEEPTSQATTKDSLILRSHVIKAIRNLTIKDQHDEHEYCVPNLVRIDSSRPDLSHLIDNIPAGNLQSLS